MRYFNGFSLYNEEEHFKEYLRESDLCVAGFSYGAQEAFEYVYHSKKRIDRLILLSPAFFQTKKPSFARTQLRYFEEGQEAYVTKFLENTSYPSDINLGKYLHVGTKNELEALLTYEWDRSRIQEVLNRGTDIEIFLGEKDKIIDSQEVFDFFAPLVTTYYIKDVGHLLIKE
jgi:pimeloyl-ACP methyl ester carboxylesterase